MWDSGREALAAAADAAVVYERGGVGQQFAKRDEAKVADCGRQVGRKLVVVFGKEDAAAAEALAGVDCGIEKLVSLVICGAG